MDLMDKEVLVVGAGVSGISSVNLLIRIGAKPSLYEGNNKVEEAKLLDKFELAARPYIKIYLGEESFALEQFDMLVLSPGVPTDLPFILTAKSLGIPVISEIELAYQFAKGKIIAITGTNGKTTTTALIGEIMKSYYEDVYVVGNIGIPFTEIALDTTDSSIIVLEVSSFQLETIQDFRPFISAILNVTPDHLNRHKTFENYIDAKVRITENQQGEFCILNYDDEITRRLGEELHKIQPLYFSHFNKISIGLYHDIDTVYWVEGENADPVPLCSLKEVKLLGAHNLENIMAGILISLKMDVPTEYIQKTISNFTGVAHRIEYVATIREVDYYNDSKATNPDAAIKGIGSMVRPTILIGGGLDKKSDFSDWISAFGNKVKALILFGETKHQIKDTANHLGFLNVYLVNTLEEAVIKADAIAIAKDAVLLSPACASWDMFKSYEERGNMFKAYVQSLKE